MKKLEDLIIGYISGEILHDASGQTLSADSPLLETGTLDSLGLQQLVQFLEKEYSIEIGDEHLTPENFESPRTIATFVSSVLETSNA
jgi:acyl carrier protein